MADQVYPVSHNGGHPPDGSWDDNPGSASRLMSQEGVYQLTQDLRRFSETLTSLKSVFCEERDGLEQSLRVVAHERLGELLKVLKNIVHKYQELNSHGILGAAESLINYVKNYNYESDDEIVPPEIFTAINNLALAFSSSVSECLIGDINISPRQSLVTSQSFENLPTQHQPGHQRQVSAPFEPVPEIGSVTVADYPLATSETVADVLAQVTENLDICFERAKAWSKYANDLMTYVKKKAHIEIEYAKQLTKLSQTTRAILSEQSYLPFQSLYCTSLDNDKEYASNLVATQQNLILAHKFIEPLQAKRIEHDRQHKALREAWRKDKRRLEEAEVNLKKAKQTYQTRNQEYQKAKDASNRADQHQHVGASDTQHNRQGSNPGSGGLGLGSVPASSLNILPTSKMEKKRKQEDDSYLKAHQAELYYRACVNEANMRRKELEKKEEQYLKTLRDLMTQCDQTTKVVTLSFFQLHYELTSPLRVQYQALLDESKNYELGFQYAEYLKHITPHQTSSRLDYQFEPYIVEGAQYTEYAGQRSEDSPLSGRSNKFSNTRRRSHQRGFSDTESSSSRSLDDISPSASPGDPPNRKDMYKRRPSTEGSLSSEEILDETPKEPTESRLHPPPPETTMSYSPESSPAPVRLLPKVMKAAANAFKGMKRNAKPTVFGVDFSVAASESPDGVPLLIKKCIAEIDNRALQVKGIYRVNGVKNRVEKLCALLDSPNCLNVDLSEQLPHDVSGVLKFFLRQLPEPLVPKRNYGEALDTAKNYHEIMKGLKEAAAAEAAAQSDSSSEILDERLSLSRDQQQEERSTRLNAAIDRMRGLIEKMPEANRNTLQYIIAHLSRIAEHSSSNMMNASNLAIIFGPNLLRPVQESGNELQTLIELPSQSQAIEMMISHRNKIFHTYSNQAKAEEKEQRRKKSTSVEELDFESGDADGLVLKNTGRNSQEASTLSSASSGEVLAATDQVHLVIDDTGDPATVPPSNEGAQRDSFSGESSQTGQSKSNGGMIDDGREIFPYSAGLRKSSSTRDVPGAVSRHKSDKRTSHDDLSIKSMSSSTPAFLSPTESPARPTSLPQQVAHPNSNLMTPKKTSEGKRSPSPLTKESPGSHETIDEAGGDGAAPVAPLRKSRWKRNEKKSVILDFPLNPGKEEAPRSPSQKSISPHRPRSRRVTDTTAPTALHHMGSGDAKDPGLRMGRTSMPASPDPGHRSKRHTTIATLIHPAAYRPSDDGKVKPQSGSTGRRLPQVPPNKTASPTRSHQVSMPGRTPPFNKTQTWSFAKSDVNAARGLEPATDPVQKKIVMDMDEDNNDEVSFC